MYVDFINLLQIKIGSILAYFPTVAFGGWLQALINKKLGDDTAANEGFLTLDPAVHFDLFGFFILIFPWQFFGIDNNFGFGKRVPIHVESISGKFKTIRTILLIFSGSIAFFVNTIFIISIFLFGIYLILKLPVLNLQMYGNLGKALIIFSQALTSLNITLFLVYTVIGVVNLIIYSVDENNFLRRNQFSIIFLILIVAILLAGPLEQLLYKLLALIFG